MKRRRFLRLVRVVGSTTIAGILSGTVAAHAAPPANGCPRGYELFAVATLAGDGYHVPALVDSPTSGVLTHGRPGNGDGFVCAVPLGNQTTSFGGQVYNFIDDTLPAS